MKRLRVPLSYPASGGFDGADQATCRGGSFAVESVAAFAWNGWQASSGISGNLGLEYACDQDFGAKTEVFVPFFGVEAPCISSPSYIARVSGASVICVSHLRLPDGQYQVRFSPVQEGFGEDLKADAEAWNRFLEAAVREHPDQYLWLHKRFKTRPEGHAAVY